MPALLILTIMALSASAQTPVTNAYLGKSTTAKSASISKTLVRKEPDGTAQCVLQLETALLDFIKTQLSASLSLKDAFLLHFGTTENALEAVDVLTALSNLHLLANLTLNARTARCGTVT